MLRVALGGSDMGSHRVRRKGLLLYRFVRGSVEGAAAGEFEPPRRCLTKGRHGVARWGPAAQVICL